MGRVLITWELGGGLGHLVRMAPIARRLAQSGHEVFLALRDLSGAERLLDGCCTGCLQAPVRTSRPRLRIEPARSFAHILHNSGFADPPELRTLARAWRSLFELVRPDLIVFDHSPLALLASRSCNAKRVLLGNGFFCPPDACPLPDFRPWLGDAMPQLRCDEDRTLSAANGLLADWDLRPREQLSQLYREVDANILATFAELDAYPGRQRAEYYGVWSNLGGPGPRWPDGTGKRVFVYLKAYPALADLLAAVKQLDQPTLVHLEPPDPVLQQRYESPSLHFEAELFDLDKVGAECDLAILHASHGAAATMLLGGTPLLSLPRHLEQALTARSIERMGAGLTAAMDNPRDAAAKLQLLVEREHFTGAARCFAARYHGYDSRRQIECAMEQLERILR